MVNDERQNYLAHLPPRLTKSQETKATSVMRDLAFAKYADDGCYVRAHVLGIQLARAGIVNTYKIWLFAPSYYTFFLNGFVKPKEGRSTWNYHVAISFVSAGVTQMIMDSAVDPQKAISYEEWLSKLQCSSGSLELRTDRSRWLPSTVTTEDKLPKEGYFSHGRNPFNGFMYLHDNNTPENVSNHLARDDVADRFAACSSVSAASAQLLLQRLTAGETFGGNGCTGVTSYFNERRQHWKLLVTAANHTE
jgi:hypothetical protein